MLHRHLNLSRISQCSKLLLLFLHMKRHHTTDTNHKGLHQSVFDEEAVLALSIWSLALLDKGEFDDLKDPPER